MFEPALVPLIGGSSPRDQSVATTLQQRSAAQFSGLPITSSFCVKGGVSATVLEGQYGKQNE